MNEVFKPAGVQFYAKSFERFRSSLFGNSNSYNSTPRTWFSVRSTLSQMFPIECGAFRDDLTFTLRDWLRIASAYWSNPSEILVVLPSAPLGAFTNTTSGTGDYPSEGSSVLIPRDFIPQYTGNLAHEFGHYFGLPHSFGNSPSCVSNNTPGCVNIGTEFTTLTNSIVDPKADAPITSLSYFWDLVYGVGPGGAGFSLFSSETAARNFEVAAGNTLLQKNLLYSSAALSGTNNSTNCEYNGSRNSIDCIINSTMYSSPSATLEGLDFVGSTPGGARTSNVMTYTVGIFDDRPVNMLSKSQIRHIRRVLKYNVRSRLFANPALWPIAGSHANELAWGDRPLLGRAPARSMSADLDFNGDNLRDLAVWTPPTTPGGVGSFSIRLAKSDGTGFETTVSSYPMGRAGDIPLPQDLNGDGRTDLVVVGKNNRGNLFDDSVAWRVRYCSVTAGSLSCPDAAATPTNPGTVVSGMGTTRDVFLPKFEADGNASTSEIGLFRPSISAFFWCTIGVNCTGTSFSSKVVGPSRTPAIPIAGLYDDDAITDLAVYGPNSGKFYLQRSGGGSSTYALPVVTHDWGLYPHVPQQVQLGADYRSGSVLLQNLTRSTSNGPRLSFGLWNPDNQRAYINWNPVTSTATPSPCTAFGNEADIPLASGIDLLQTTASTGRSDLLLFEPSPDAVTNGSLRFADIGDSGCVTGTFPTASKLSGLISNDTMVYVTGDWDGDQKPDLVVVNRMTMSWTGYGSKSSYNTSVNIGAFGSNSSSLL